VNQSRRERIRSVLEEAFAPTTLEVIDESHHHVGHAGARDGRGHFRVRIGTVRFAGLSRVQVHRLIFGALGSMMQTEIHALSIELIEPAPVHGAE
jgi:BolA family transcriptional regulator, general stress-responsive regulator